MKLTNNKCSLLSMILLFATASACAKTGYSHFTGTHQKFKQTSNKVVGTYIANWSNPSTIDDVPVVIKK